MIHGARGGVVGFLILSSCACALAFAGGCSSDDDASDGRPAADSSVAPVDANSPQVDSSQPITDSSVEDAADASDATAATGCGAHPTAAFCDDFDSPDALTEGKTKWDIIERSATQPLVTLSTTQAVSTPNSILTQIIDGTTPGARFVKTITKAGFVESTWDYDIYLDNVGQSDGFFLDDFQFAENDTFGFRLVTFAKPGGAGLDFVRVEHNHQALGGGDDIEGNIADGVITTGKWHHFTQNVKFKFASTDAGDGGDAGASTVTYTLTVDGASTPAFTKTYPGISRTQASFTRFAGLPYVFNKGNSAGLKIYWDNHVTDLK